jgi:hypothetical protein
MLRVLRCTVAFQKKNVSLRKNWQLNKLDERPKKPH